MTAETIRVNRVILQIWIYCLIVYWRSVSQESIQIEMLTENLQTLSVTAELSLLSLYLATPLIIWLMSSTIIWWRSHTCFGEKSGLTPHRNIWCCIRRWAGLLQSLVISRCFWTRIKRNYPSDRSASFSSTCSFYSSTNLLNFYSITSRHSEQMVGEKRVDSES